PIDDRTLYYMTQTNRPADQIQLVEDYAKANMLWRKDEDKIKYTRVIELDLSSVEPTVSGPKRPQDKILLKDFKIKFGELLEEVHGRRYTPFDKRDKSRWFAEGGRNVPEADKLAETELEVEMETKTKQGLKSVVVNLHNERFELHDGSIVIASITSCTNTSNPSEMICS